jgi:hypothetical protein
MRTLGGHERLDVIRMRSRLLEVALWFGQGPCGKRDGTAAGLCAVPQASHGRWPMTLPC